MGDHFIRSVGPITVWRCTEAIDPKSGYTYRTIGNPDGRCVEIATSRGTMLMDRRLAIEVACAILDIAGPSQELPSDVAAADIVEVEYDERGHHIGFRPYLPRNGSALEDARAFIEKVRLDKGLPPSSLLDLSHAHG